MATRRTRQAAVAGADPPRAHRARERAVVSDLGWWWALVAGVGISGSARFLPVLRLAFLSDDYLILDKVWWRNFVQLWWRDYNIFGWYRPWSRELHFWTLFHLGGLDVRPYHIASLVLWWIVLALFALYVRREAGTTPALIATTGVSALASWGAPLSWIAGCQELWLCLWSLLYLHALARRRDGWALLPLLLAFLSKETAIALPLLGAAYVGLVRRDSSRVLLRRLAADAALAIAWVAWHPTLLPRILHGDRSIGDRLPSQWLAIPYSLLSFVNLESWPRPEGSSWLVLMRGVWRFLPLLGLALLCLRAPVAERGSTWRDRALFGLIWVAVGVGGLLNPTIGWHAYYAVFAATGAWYLMGMLLERQRWLAVAMLGITSVLEPLRAETPSWDWASFAYQERAGIYTGQLRQSLVSQIPAVPPHTRFYFAEIPQNIGFVTADGPAFRVLYRDSTLRGWFIGEYQPRSATQPSGLDIFLRFDGVAGLRRMVPAAPPPPGAGPDELEAWESDQRMLAWVFGRSHEWRRAADQFANLAARFPESLEYEANAFDCYRRAGDAVGTAEYAERARRLGRVLPPPTVMPAIGAGSKGH